MSGTHREHAAYASYIYLFQLLFIIREPLSPLKNGVHNDSFAFPCLGLGEESARLKVAERLVTTQGLCLPGGHSAVVPSCSGVNAFPRKALSILVPFASARMEAATLRCGSWR